MLNSVFLPDAVLLISVHNLTKSSYIPTVSMLPLARSTCANQLFYIIIADQNEPEATIQLLIINY